VDDIKAIKTLATPPRNRSRVSERASTRITLKRNSLNPIRYLRIFEAAKKGHSINYIIAPRLSMGSHLTIP